METFPADLRLKGPKEIVVKNRIVSASLFGLLVLLLGVASAYALSIQRNSPGIEYPKNFDKKTASAIDSVLTDKQFHYLNGLTNYWEPKYETTLVYDGDVSSLNHFIARMTAVRGIRVHLTFSHDLSKETGSALSAGSWWVMYSRVTPNVVTIRINLAAPKLANLEITLPEFRPAPDLRI